MDETLSMQIQGATDPVDVDLHFKYPRGEEEIISSTEHITLSRENRFQAVVKLKLSWKLSFDY